jgi:2-polyprenyl-3-methyl-5-hydroxy-6-metoxy-1,4-benzoquinol methylase
MTLQLIDVLEIEAVERFTFSEVAKLCELSHEETQELIDYGAIKSDDSDENDFFYSTQKLSLLQSACKQRRDYDLDLFSVVICVQYLEHIEDLKRQIESLQAVSRS